MKNRDIIVIGGSAGATAPLKNLLGRLSPDLPAAVLIALHIPSHGIGTLSSVASAAGPLPVIEAETGVRIEDGRVYLAAPDRHLLVQDGRILLGRGPRENMVRPAIDALFRSAALHYGPRVIGVLLSGFLSDGAAGLNAIKRCGGMTLVQDPDEAIADEMPRRALEATTVDLCVPSARIGDVLSDLAREAPGTTLPIPPEIALEVEIAAGGRIGSDRLGNIASPTSLICPSCGGVLSKLNVGNPSRFRCQLGHAFAADTLAGEQESRVDEPLRVALRLIEERAELAQRKADERQRFLLAELQHRVRNTLGVVRSIARRSALTSTTVEEYASHLDGRLNAFARTQAFVTRDPEVGVDLEYLVVEELLAYHAREGEQLHVSGPSIRLQLKPAETFALALHELATNAVKYGALAKPEGRIAVTWQIDRSSGTPQLVFDWIEKDGPKIDKPARRGFGSELLEQTLRFELKTRTTLSFDPSGFHCKIVIPIGPRLLQQPLPPP
jgi:two-component system, chemotaxis family, protein-glutamate methylesterase/glutaminase